MLEYTIITRNRVYSEDNDTEKLFNEQQEKLNALGFHSGGNYLCHFFDSHWFDESTKDCTIDEAIQYLAIKDGADLVQFENRNYGFVAYYNGCENGFEFIG